MVLRRRYTWFGNSGAEGKPRLPVQEVRQNSMHIPDNYLSPQTCAVMGAVMVPVWTVCIRRLKVSLPGREVSRMGVAAAFSFLGMMFNVPMPGGTTGHAVGGTLIALVLGPYAACIAVSTALLLQALLFGDGGILSFGANCFNMAFVLPFTGWVVAGAVRKLLKNSRRGDLISAGIGAYAGINAGALCAAVEFGIQPMLFRDAAGNAMYCPYGLQVAVPAMMAGHLTVFGAAEVLFTVAILGFLQAGGALSFPDTGGRTPAAVKVLLTALVVLTPLGLLAQGTAWGEWDAGEIAATGAGYTPSGMRGGALLQALLPEYSLAGMPAWTGYVISAAAGAALLIILFRLAAGLLGKTGIKRRV